MNIVITGSNGFIGQNLIREINSRFKDAKITCLVRKEKKSTDNIIYSKVNYLDPETLQNEKSIEEADYIYHVAGVTKSHNWEGFYKGNIVPTENLLVAIRQSSKNLKRFVLVSSGSAAGPAKSLEKMTKESDPDEPMDLYGKSKLEAELLVKRFGDKIPYTIIRPGGVYGPGDVDFFNIFKMTIARFNVYAGVKQKYISLVYVEDLVRGIVDAALSENTINETYFLNDDRPLTWQAIHETIFEICDKKPINISIPFGIIYAASYLGSGFCYLTGKANIFNKNKIELSKPEFWIADNTKAKKDFNYQTKFGLRESLLLTKDWYVKNGWLKI